jgi:protein-tyrosine phosphatase
VPAAVNLHGVDGFRLAGAPNARDLGGLPGAAGRRVRAGVLYRAPALGRLTDEDGPRLDGLGLAEIIDLRHRHEIDIAPADRLPPGLPVTALPIYDPDNEYFQFMADVMGRGNGVRVPAADEPARAMAGVYRWFVHSPVARAGFAQAVRRIAAAAGRPVLYHCSAGKDRTGWLTAIVLTVLGVPRDVIMADYLRTNEDTGVVIEKIVSALVKRRGANPDLVRAVLVVTPGYLDASYDEVDRRYGSFDGYLRQALDLDDEVLDRLRETLLD